MNAHGKTLAHTHTQAHTHLPREVGDGVGVHKSSASAAEERARAGRHTGGVRGQDQGLLVRRLLSTETQTTKHE